MASPGSALRIGIAGLGFGRAVHLPALQALPGVEIAGVFGRNPVRVAAAAAAAGVPGFTDLDGWLEASRDGVTVALPPDVGAPVVAAALQRGRAVLAEKPLAASLATAAQLVALADGRTTAMDFQFAELESFGRLKAELAGAVMGPVRHVHLLWLTHSYAQRSRQWSWKTDAERCGGALSMLGSHALFLAEWLFGAVTGVHCRTDPRWSGSFAPDDGARPADDLVHLHLELASGACLSAVIGSANPGMSRHTWTVVCDGGSYVLDNTSRDYMSGFTLESRAADDRVTALAADPPLPGVDGRLVAFGRLATRFAAAIRDRVPCAPDFAAGHRVQALIAASHASAAQGRVIAL
ncbi:MAG: hypothetical protein GC191_09840 [Azospirillum sp.]|nr:hypothetical protein [Azospirillum sp.]